MYDPILVALLLTAVMVFVYLAVDSFLFWRRRKYLPPDDPIKRGLNSEVQLSEAGFKSVAEFVEFCGRLEQLRKAHRFTILGENDSPPVPGVNNLLLRLVIHGEAQNEFFKSGNPRARLINFESKFYPRVNICAEVSEQALSEENFQKLTDLLFSKLSRQDKATLLRALLGHRLLKIVVGEHLNFTPIVTLKCYLAPASQLASISRLPTAHHG